MPDYKIFCPECGEERGFMQEICPFCGSLQNIGFFEKALAEFEWNCIAVENDFSNLSLLRT